MSIRKYVVTCVIECEVDDENLADEQYATAGGVDDEFNSWLKDLGFVGDIYVMRIMGV